MASCDGGAAARTFPVQRHVRSGPALIGPLSLSVWHRHDRCTDSMQGHAHSSGDLADRSTDLFAHYADGGVLPRITVMNYFWNTNWISVHMMNGTASWQGFLFILQGIAAACMSVGFFTKTATFATWFLLTSLHGRNPLVLHGGACRKLRQTCLA